MPPAARESPVRTFRGNNTEKHSSGIWAPSLSYADGRFWLVFTIASGSRLHSYETFNYLTTAKEITGPWTEPVYLNATGNDPSLFHDDDGRKYILNSDFQWDPGSEIHSGTVLQEYSAEDQKLTGRVKNIFRGTDLGVVEGSKMYKRNGWYFLHRQYDMENGAQIALYSKTNNNVTLSNLGQVSISDGRMVKFGVDCDGTSLRFRTLPLQGHLWGSQLLI